MQTGMIRPEQLDPRATYCVVTDLQTREATLTSGRRIQQDAPVSREFRRFGRAEVAPDNHVLVDFGTFSLALWRDPTRPELHVVDDGGEPEQVATVEDPEAVPVEPEIPALVGGGSDEPWWEEGVGQAAQGVAHSLYVQS